MNSTAVTWALPLERLKRVDYVSDLMRREPQQLICGRAVLAKPRSLQLYSTLRIYYGSSTAITLEMVRYRKHALHCTT